MDHLHTESAKWQQSDAAADDAPSQQPMSQSAKPIQRRKPTQDQKRVRREMARKTADVTVQHQPDTHTRVIPEDDDFDQYLVRRCGDHGTAVVGDRASQEHYIAAAQQCHDEASRPGHQHQHAAEGSDCWSCCPTMYVAKPGERESGRTAARRVMANIDHAGDRECEACGRVAAPVLGDTGPACRSCGSYSLKRSPYARPAQAIEHQPSRDNFGRVATRFETNVATSDGRILLNPGDAIKTPTGQTLNVKQVRRHETSRDHYYVDTDAGTTVVPWSTSFTLMPSNGQQQALPGTGIPGGNFNHLPFNPQANGQEATSGDTAGSKQCPVCGNKSMNRNGGKFQCSTCGYTDNPVGAGMSFGDASQVIMSNPRTSSADHRSVIARHAALVLDQTKETPL